MGGHSTHGGMMSDSNTPALTAEQWRQSIVTEGLYASREVFLVDGVLTVDCGQQHRFPSATDDTDDVTPHAIAALALYNQPYGFTRVDLVAIDEAIDAMSVSCGLLCPAGCDCADGLRSLRNRIGALLPPEA